MYRTVMISMRFCHPLKMASPLKKLNFMSKLFLYIQMYFTYPLNKNIHANNLMLKTMSNIVAAGNCFIRVIPNINITLHFTHKGNQKKKLFYEGT